MGNKNQFGKVSTWSLICSFINIVLFFFHSPLQNAMLTHHSGYTDEEAKEMAKKLNQMLLTPHFNPANEIYNKYSHE